MDYSSDEKKDAAIIFQSMRRSSCSNKVSGHKNLQINIEFADKEIIFG
jgi:hypothetical protein